eukprot:180049-Pyramimonas_sp.AAC.1
MLSLIGLDGCCAIPYTRRCIHPNDAGSQFTAHQPVTESERPTACCEYETPSTYSANGTGSSCPASMAAFTRT